MKFNLFKYSKPIIRRFEPVGETAGDVPYIWDAYQKGLIKDIPQDLGMEEFMEMANELYHSLEMEIVEDNIHGEVVPIGLIYTKNNGCLIEPHVVWFDNATPRAIYRSYVGYLKRTRYRKDIRACLIRVDNRYTKFLNRLEKLRLVEYVGKIWGGRPEGNDYLYSVRCSGKTHMPNNTTRH